MSKTKHDLKLDVDPTQGIADAVDSIPLTEDLRLTTNTPSNDDWRWKKLFGFVSARPHEYLIHIRKAKLLPKTSGQASQCFKWPGDTVIIVPTSLKQLVFEAGQLTLDNVHVRIKGYAVYRITNPEKTSNLISFWDRWEGEKKLAQIIGEPCRSHTKWLIANMSVEDCLRKRKEAIADILLKELRLAINEDEMGVSVISVDIQDVRIHDRGLFEAYQGPSKEKIFQAKELAELERKRQSDLIKLTQEQEIATQKKTVELARVENAEEIRVRKLNYERAELEEQRKRKHEETEHSETLATMRDQQRLAREQRSAEVAHQIEVQNLQLAKQKVEAALAELRDRVGLENQLTPIALEKAYMEKALPGIAAAIASSLSDARLTIYHNQGDHGGSPFSLVMNEIMHILHDRLNKLAAGDGCVFSSDQTASPNSGGTDA